MRWICGLTLVPDVNEADGWLVMYTDGMTGPASSVAVAAAANALRVLAWVREGGGTADGPPDPRTTPIRPATLGVWVNDQEQFTSRQIWAMMVSCDDAIRG